MEIATLTTGGASNVRNALKHCAKKKSAQIAVLYCNQETCEFVQGLFMLTTKLFG